MQDKYGFMWFSTDGGLNRFDGLKFTVFSSGNKNPNLSLLGRNVFDIATDSSTNILWALTVYGGLNKIDVTTLSVVGGYALTDPKSGRPLWPKCLAIKKNNIFIGTNEGIALKFNSTTNKIEQQKKFSGQIKDVHIDDIFTDTQDRVWLFLSGYGIVITDTNFHEIKSIPALQFPFDTRSNILFWGHAVWEQKLLLATNEGLKIISINNVIPLGVHKIFGELANAMPQHEIRAISEKNGEIILCGRSDSYVLDVRKRQIVKIVPSRNYEDKDWFMIINCVYQTDQSIWIGSEKGLGWIKNKNSPFNAIYSSMNGNKIRLNNCFTLCNFDDSTVVVCAEDGLYKVNHTADIISKYDSSDFFVLAFKDLRKNILACSFYHGLRMYDKDERTLNISAVYPELLPIKNNSLTSCQQLGDSIFFLASLNKKGVYIWNIKRKTIEFKDTSSRTAPLQDNEIKSLYLDSKKCLWILCDNAISIYNPFNKTMESLDLTIPGKNERINTIMDICELKNNYWLASYGRGIVELGSDYKIKNIYGEKDGINNSAVFKIYPLNDSCLIVSSNVGLSVLNINSKAVNNYFEEDGLQSNTFNETSGCRTKDYIFFGGNNGMTKIDIKKLTSNTRPPIFYFTGIKTETQDGLLDTSNLQFAQVKIPSNWLQTDISFVGINYLNPQRVTYEYRLKETGSTWISLGTQNFIDLIGLSPDTYTLEVKAANEDGVWCEPKTLTLIFLPKWYQTAWFKAAVILFVGGIFYAIYRYRISQLKKQQQIRHEIASDLHDDLGATLNSVRIFTNLAEASPQKEEYFQQIKDSINTAYLGLRDMIWVLDDTGDTVADLLKRIKQFAQPFANANDIHVHFSEEDNADVLELNKAEKRNLLLIAKEAINNCIKYANCKKIHVAFSKENRKIKLVIKDDGCGFDEKEIIYGHGLKNIRERAKQINYTASIHSEKGQGTTIVVTEK